MSRFFRQIAQNIAVNTFVLAKCFGLYGGKYAIKICAYRLFGGYSTDKDIRHPVCTNSGKRILDIKKAAPFGTA